MRIPQLPLATIFVMLWLALGIAPALQADPPPNGEFVPLFDGKSMNGWVGNTSGYAAQDGALVCLPGRGNGGNIFTEKEYGNFVFQFQFKLTPGANNGLALRCPLEGKPHGRAYESQILDNSAKRYANLKASQYHGSLYKLVAAKRGHLKPVGEWNQQEVMMNGHHVRITLNGVVILEDKDLGRFRRPSKGHLGFLGHGSRVEFRELKIKELPE